MRQPKQKSALQAIEEGLEILRSASTLEGTAKEGVEVLLDLSGRPKPANGDTLRDIDSGTRHWPRSHGQCLEGRKETTSLSSGSCPKSVLILLGTAKLPVPGAEYLIGFPKTHKGG